MKKNRGNGKWVGMSEKMKPEIKVCLVVDNYKVKNKEDWWKKSLATQPHIEQHYDLVKETPGPLTSPETQTFIRHYKLKGTK